MARDRRGTTSAGLLLFRQRDGAVEVLLGHPGGPFWRARDEESWTLPKGESLPDEVPIAVARREFAEETGHAAPDGPLIELGEVTLRSGKRVVAWALEGDLDPGAAHSNTFLLEFPRRSGRTIEVPELDRVAWFDLAEARRRLAPAQAPFLDRLALALEGKPALEAHPTIRARDENHVTGLG